jgi:hypothetical protein
VANAFSLAGGAIMLFWIALAVIANIRQG